MRKDFSEGKSLGDQDISFLVDHPHSASDQKHRLLRLAFHEKNQAEREHLIRHREWQLALFGKGGHSKIGANPHPPRQHRLHSMHPAMNQGQVMPLYRQVLRISNKQHLTVTRNAYTSKNSIRH